MRFLTFDLGTTLYKVALFDDAGRLLALRRVPPMVLHPKPPWWELDPRTFQQPLLEAARALRQEVGGFNDVAAVSFATQANSFVLLDERNEALTPIILWPDQRAADLREELEMISNLPDFSERTGMPRFSHALGLAKVLRWKHHNPRVLEQTRRFCYLSDLFTLWMTGQHVSEGGVAGISGAMDLRSFAWWDDLLARVGMQRAQMPAIVRAGTDLGPVRADVAAELGLPPTCRFIVGCLDQYAGAIGTGTVTPAAVCETTGTVLAAVRCADRLDSDPGGDVFQGPGFDEKHFFQMSFSSTSANLLEHYRLQLGLSFDEMTKLAASSPPGDIETEPYYPGESMEKWFEAFKDIHNKPGQVARAIMKRVALSLKEQMAALCRDEKPSEIRSAGGAARNDFWLQLKADTLGIAFAATECEEPTSLGAAMLAARAMGLGSLPELAAKWVKIRRRFVPRGGNAVS